MRFISAIFLALFITGCNASDISIVDRKETQVIVDSFIQSDPIEEIDVLVSLDTSGSMSDNYENVASGMDLLRLDIESLTLDYQFGYITMDPTNLGYIGPFDASSSSIDMLLAPSLLPNAGLEEGFAATYMFLNSEEGVSFRRDDADFLLFLISDEDEQSSISSLMFYDWMHEEFSDVSHDLVAISNPDDENAGWHNEVGYKYIEISTLYNKELVDIKAADWSSWLSDSSYLTSSIDRIELSQEEPIEESIVVYVDGFISYDWEYEESLNTVILSFVPDYGTLVEVGYKIYI